MSKLLHALFRPLVRSSPALFGVALVGLVFHAGAASAASLTVAVRQVNPDSAVQTVTCDMNQKNCTLPFVINANQSTQQSVTIHVTYLSGNILALGFQTAGGYFYTGLTMGNAVMYNPLWHVSIQNGTPANYPVTLFQPLSPDMIGPLSSSSHTSVATLSIATTLNP